VISDSDVAEIVGAFWAPDLELFRLLLDATWHLGGDLAELGVLYGRSAVLIGDYLQPGETFTVVDLFGTAASDAANDKETGQWYPGLTQAAFEHNYLTLHQRLPKIVVGHSGEIANHAAHGAHRFVHIDASHLYEHVAADLRAAKLLLKPPGIVVLDDFRAEHTPGVAAAGWQAVTETGLSVFALSPQKLYATWGDPQPWRDTVRMWVNGSGYRYESQTINGQEIIRVQGTKIGGPHPVKRYVPEVMWPSFAKLNQLSKPLQRAINRRNAT
jgi:hypothetical protein